MVCGRPLPESGWRHALSIAPEDVSPELLSLLEADIQAAGGALPFPDYMQRVLNEPGLGYYHRRAGIFGASGDFVTAPELGALFARALARAVIAELQAADASEVLELGAGSGALAAELLSECAALGRPISRYSILETSTSLRADQATRLKGAAVTWLSTLPQAFRGVVIANEVLDALPVECFAVRSQGLMRRVVAGSASAGFRWSEVPAPAPMLAAVRRLEAQLGRAFPEGYCSEYSPWLPAFVRSIASRIEAGAILFADYGYERRDYYALERSQGTLICHSRHRAHDDPFHLPGLTDISAWVDFEAVAEAATAAGLSVRAYQTQTQFLLENGLLEALATAEGAAPGELARVKLAQEAERLLLPGDMGTRFKVLTLGR